MPLSLSHVKCSPKRRCNLLNGTTHHIENTEYSYTGIKSCHHRTTSIANGLHHTCLQDQNTGKWIHQQRHTGCSQVLDTSSRIFWPHPRRHRLSQCCQIGNTCSSERYWHTFGFDKVWLLNHNERAGNSKANKEEQDGGKFYDWDDCLVEKFSWWACNSRPFL